MESVPITKKLIAFGSKKIYLPKFTIALIRTPTLSPYHARFLVPLDFSKYDLRDYLYHAYSIRCHAIRSFVKRAPMRDTQERLGHMFFPESKKYMTVEMEQPFVWPPITTLKPWGKESVDMEAKSMTHAQGQYSPQELRQAARTLGEQAKRLVRKGRLRWEKSRTGQVVKRLDGPDFLIKV